MDARSPSRTTNPESASWRRQDEEDEEEGWLHCVDCGARITPLAAGASINGAHEHEFMNPSGLRFTVRCFTRAPGCRGEGERSKVWSWFPGFAWQIELCRSCACHIGWSFHAASTFYGLIRERIVPAPPG